MASFTGLFSRHPKQPEQFFNRPEALRDAKLRITTYWRCDGWNI